MVQIAQRLNTRLATSSPINGLTLASLSPLRLFGFNAAHNDILNNSKINSKINLKNKNLNKNSAEEFITKLTAENNHQVDYISVARACSSIMMGKYQRYQLQVNALTKTQKKIIRKERVKAKEKGYISNKSFHKIQNLHQQIQKYQRKLASCTPENLEIIKQNIKKNKFNEKDYRDQAMRDAAQGLFCNYNKNKSQKNYINIKQNWLWAARRAYWPRLAGAFLHITGCALGLVGMLAKTPPMIASYFFAGFARIMGDAAMGSFRLQFKAFEEMNCEVFFKPSGKIDNGAGVLQAHQQFKDALNLAQKNNLKYSNNSNNSNNLKNILSGRLNYQQIKTASKNLNSTEKAQVKALKNQIAELRAARYREKNELHGNAGQLHNNIWCGIGQLTCSTLKLIPEPTTQIIGSSLSLALAGIQHFRNFKMAGNDFCRKMEQTAISQINYISQDAAFKTSIQTELNKLENLKNINSNSGLNSEIDFKINSEINSEIKKTKNNINNLFKNLDKIYGENFVTKNLTNSATHVMSYRLKNIIDYQTMKLCKAETQLEKIKNKINNKNINDKDLEKLEKLEKNLAIRKNDLEILEKMVKCKNSTAMQNHLKNLQNQKLRDGLSNKKQALKLMIKSKKMVRGEMFRYVISYFAPSIASSTILLPLLLTGVFLDAGNPAKPATQGITSIISNMIAAGQQIGTSNNNSERDVFKHKLKAQLKVLDTNLSINLSKSSSTNSNSSKNSSTDLNKEINKEIKKEISQTKNSFIVSCLLGAILGPYRHYKASQTIETYGDMIDAIVI